MNQGMVNTVISAVVGGVIGASVVFFAGGTGKKLELAELKVAKLTITDHAVLLNAENNPDLILKDGSVLAENVVLAKKVVAKQLQAHAMVANRMFATPDDLMATKMEDWKFYAEIGASSDGGGEILVRSANGPAAVNRPTTSGSWFRMGYDPELNPQMLAISNANRNQVRISSDLSETQMKMISANMSNPQGTMPPGNYNSPTTAPISNDMIPSSTSIATRPDGTYPQ